MSALAWPVKAMNFQTGKRELLEQMAGDDSVCFEQKVDGTRALILLHERDEPVVVNRHGAPMKHAATLPVLPQILKALPRGHGTTVLDCEVMWAEGFLLVFDMPYAEWPLSPRTGFETPYGERREALERWYRIVEDREMIRLVGHARTTEDKKGLAQAVQRMNGEGVMVKHLASPYMPGSRVSHSLKVKFTKTADVIVTGISRGVSPDTGAPLGSITFGVLHDDVPGFDVTVGFGLQGSCSAIGRPDVVPGDVIEVEYLAYMAGGGLREPRMVRVREDKTLADCRMSQFTEHSKAVL